MWKFLGTLGLMLAGGVGTLAVAVQTLMVLGQRLHNNYEYYGAYPALYVGPALVGVVAPGLLVWYLRSRRVHQQGTRSSAGGTPCSTASCRSGPSWRSSTA